jgi:hypothetical protein
MRFGFGRRNHARHAGGDNFQHKLASFAGVSAEVAARQPPRVPQGRWVRGQRVPLTAGQHILHLLLTVLTGGLWGIVWAIRSAQGNRPWHWVPDAR